MKSSLVRYWCLAVCNPSDGKTDELLITYPEDNAGFDLITCLNCGKIYAASVTKQVYAGPPLKDKLKGMNCLSCGKDLAQTFAQYPENYLSHTGEVRKYVRSDIIPDTEDSIVGELPDVYS